MIKYVKKVPCIDKHKSSSKLKISTNYVKVRTHFKSLNTSL